MAATTSILYSTTRDRYYIGCTESTLEERLSRHNCRNRGFTGTTSNWVVVYAEEYSILAEVRTRERQLKGWKNRQRLERLIQRSGKKNARG